MYIYMYIHMYIYMWFICIFKCVYMYFYMYIYMYICIYSFTYLFIHSYVYLFKYINNHAGSQLRSPQNPQWVHERRIAGASQVKSSWVLSIHVNPYGGFHSHGGTQKWMVYNGKYQTKNGWWTGVPLWLRKPPYWSVIFFFHINLGWRGLKVIWKNGDGLILGHYGLTSIQNLQN